MRGERDRDHEGDLAGIREEEWHLSCPGRPEGHLRAPHEAEHAAQVLEEQRDVTGKDENSYRRRFVRLERRRVRNRARNGSGDEVARQVAHGCAAERGDHCPAAGEHGEREADQQEDRGRGETAAPPEDEAREDDGRVL